MQPDNDENQWKKPPDSGKSAPYVANDAGMEEPSGATSEDMSSQYDQETAQQQATDTNQDIDDTLIVRWQAAEYIHREKNALWYLVFGIVVLLLLAVAFYLMHSITFVVLLFVMAAALVVYSQRPPRLLDYTLSQKGLHVNDRLYPFSDFKGFSVIHGDDEYSIMLLPIKRLKPGVSIYFPEDKGEQIVDAMAARLPMDQAQIDFVDRLIKKLRI